MVLMARLMQGFPPEAAGQVTLANWRASPFNRWGFHHVRELIPTADIAHDPDRQSKFVVEPGNFEMPWFRDFLTKTDTDALAIVHRGRLVFEHYANGTTAETPHILMSVSNSMLGLLVGVLAARGELGLERPVTEYVSELKGNRVPRRHGAPAPRHAHRRRLRRGLPRHQRADDRLPQVDRLEPGRAG